MPGRPDAIYRLRRFRVAVVAVVAFPSVITLPLAALSGSNFSLFMLVFTLTLNACLVFFAWRKPGGFATWWIVLRQFGTALCYFSFGDDAFTQAVGTIEVLFGILLIGLIVSLWPDIRRQRADEDELLRSMDAFSRGEARSAMRERERAQRRMERHGYS